MDQVQDERAEFVMSFVDSSQKDRDEFEDIWDEVESNYLVRSLRDTQYNSVTKYPFLTSRDDPRGHAGYAILKDPETHQEIMTIVAKIVLTTMGQTGFVNAKPVGLEDAIRGRVAGKLIEYDLGLPGHFWASMQWVLNSCVYGTGIIENYWDYREEPRPVRVNSVDPLTGALDSQVSTQTVPVYDDPRLCLVDIRDFFPDFGGTSIDRMVGVAKRFVITADEALNRAARGMYDKQAVLRAIQRSMSDTNKGKRSEGRSTEEITLGTDMRVPFHRFMPIIGYEYYGDVPTREADRDKGFNESDGIYRRVVTVLGGETVRNDPWPRRVPFFECKIIPRLNAFYGLGIAEIIRYDQDFADTLKMMLANGVVRAIHAQPLVNRNAQVDMAKLRRFRPDVPIFVNGDPSAAVMFQTYNPPLQHGYGLHAGTKQAMREATGALGAVQGLGLGINRASATEAQQTFQMALDRPELYATVLEREWLPPLGKYLIELNREFLEDDMQLALRIGESEAMASLLDIDADFDLEFVGSRLSKTPADKLNAYRELFSLGANPMAAPMVPWPFLIREFINDGLGLHEMAAMVANPQLMAGQMMLQQMGGPNAMAGNGNGTVPSNPPVGAPPEQTMGSELPL